MKTLWYLSSIFTIFLILISSPKASSLGNISDSSQLFSYTKSTQVNIQLITILLTTFFLLLTIILTSHSTL